MSSSQLSRPESSADTRRARPRFTFEGPWDIGDPVHELITERALRKAGIIAADDPFTSDRAWEFVRGVIWNDDPEGLLFENDATDTDDWSTGSLWLARLQHYRHDALAGTYYAQHSPLFARSHFGDLQCLHCMAARDGERPEVTLRCVLQWAEFFYAVASGVLSERTPIGTLACGHMREWFPQCGTTVGELFRIGAQGNARERAMGALLHVIEDSFARGHVARRDDGAIEEFHAYVHQDPERHSEHDDLGAGGIDAMPNALCAVELCAGTLRLWRAGRGWPEAEHYLAQRVFWLAPDARPASAGEGMAGGVREASHFFTRSGEVR